MYDIRMVYKVSQPLTYTDRFEKEDFFSIGETPEEALQEALKNRTCDGSLFCFFGTVATREE